MSSTTLLHWSGHALVADQDDPSRYEIAAADSLLVHHGRAFALGMHYERFVRAVVARGGLQNGITESSIRAFWDAAFGTIPLEGAWFPRVELQSDAGATRLAFRQRAAPEITRSVTLVTHQGPDPRRVPSIKGPDLAVLVSERRRVQHRGADDVVLVTERGHVIDAGTNALVWWRGETLCGPPPESEDADFARVQSVTANTLFGLASALGIDSRTERTSPEDLDGAEVWALNALHGIRMVTGWVNGPKLAEKPGRIRAWRDRRDALRAPIGDQAP